MTTENPIIGTITVSAPFEREDVWYDVEVVFNLHEDGQRSLRSQDVVRGVYIDKLQDFEEEADAVLHAHDTRELRIEVEQLRRENARLRAALVTLECPCCGNVGAIATYFEDGQETICGCGGTVFADGDAYIVVSECGNAACAADESASPAQEGGGA